MSNIVHFRRRQEVGPRVRHKLLQKTWEPRFQRRARRIVVQCRNLFLAALVGGLATQYVMKYGPSNSNSFQPPAANALTSKVTSTSLHFELCGQRTRTNCVVDGDTIWYGGIKIRLATIDAPEIHDYKCSSELALGERSKRRLLELMNAGPFEVVSSGSRDEDKYGRKLRDIRRHGKSLGGILIAEGLASPWEGQHHAWCG